MKRTIVGISEEEDFKTFKKKKDNAITESEYDLLKSADNVGLGALALVALVKKRTPLIPFHERKYLPTTMKRFLKLFPANRDIGEGILCFAMNKGAIIAGGSAVYCMCSKVSEESVGDVDIFVNSKEMFMDLLNYIKPWAHEIHYGNDYYNEEKYGIIETKKPICCTFRADLGCRIPIQVIYQTYSDINELFSFFNLDYTCCGFHQYNAYSTIDCREAHETMTVRRGYYTPFRDHFEKAVQKGFHVPFIFGHDRFDEDAFYKWSKEFGQSPFFYMPTKTSKKIPDFCILPHRRRDPRFEFDFADANVVTQKTKTIVEEGSYTIQELWAGVQHDDRKWEKIITKSYLVLNHREFLIKEWVSIKLIKKN
jgi:hypothetical protein